MGSSTVRVYRQHICKPQYQQLKCKEHFRNCGKEKLKIFPFFKIHSNSKCLKEYNNIFEINLN